MNEFWLIVISGMFAVLLFDASASWASVKFKFNYAKATIGSVIIYGVIGFLIYPRYGLNPVIYAALLVGLIDTTLGWFISRKMGAMALAETLLTPAKIIATILTVLVFNIAFAFIGVMIAR